MKKTNEFFIGKPQLIFRAKGGHSYYRSSADNTVWLTDLDSDEFHQVDVNRPIIVGSYIGIPLMNGALTAADAREAREATEKLGLSLSLDGEIFVSAKSAGAAPGSVTSARMNPLTIVSQWLDSQLKRLLADTATAGRSLARSADQMEAAADTSALHAITFIAKATDYRELANRAELLAQLETLVTGLQAAAVPMKEGK